MLQKQHLVCFLTCLLLHTMQHSGLSLFQWYQSSLETRVWEVLTLFRGHKGFQKPVILDKTTLTLELDSPSDSTALSTTLLWLTMGYLYFWGSSTNYPSNIFNFQLLKHHGADGVMVLKYGHLSSGETIYSALISTNTNVYKSWLEFFLQKEKCYVIKC